MSQLSFGELLISRKIKKTCAFAMAYALRAGEKNGLHSLAVLMPALAQSWEIKVETSK